MFMSAGRNGFNLGIWVVRMQIEHNHTAVHIARWPCQSINTLRRPPNTGQHTRRTGPLTKEEMLRVEIRLTFELLHV
jgi:hypothetical protein